MQVLLEPTLVGREKGLLTTDLDFNVLLVYEDNRLLDAAMELLIIGVRGMAGDNRCHCVICQSDLLREPLLVRVALDEVSAADILILAARSDMPHKGHDWATLWVWTHPPVQNHFNFENPDRIAQTEVAWLQKIGTLDAIDLFTLGGDDFRGRELQKEMRRGLPTRAKSSPCRRQTQKDESFGTFPTTGSDSQPSPGKGGRNHGNRVHLA